MAKMTANEIVTLSAMMDFFKDDLNTISKRKLKHKANFVLDLKLNEYKITATVRASVKDESYMIALTVNGDDEILQGHCERPRVNRTCSHMAATAIYANKKGILKTDLPNSWICSHMAATAIYANKKGILKTDLPNSWICSHMAATAIYANKKGILKTDLPNSWICSHMAATAIYANKKGISKTDLPNSWIAKPRNAAKVEVKKFKDFFPLLSPNTRLYQCLSLKLIDIFYAVVYPSCQWKGSIAQCSVSHGLNLRSTHPIHWHQY